MHIATCGCVLIRLLKVKFSLFLTQTPHSRDKEAISSFLVFNRRQRLWNSPPFQEPTELLLSFTSIQRPGCKNKPYGGKKKKNKNGWMNSAKVQITSRLPFSVELTSESYRADKKTPLKWAFERHWCWWGQHFHGNLLMFLQSWGNLLQ